ncbi:hypothetical protein GGS23DRAFT_561506 [Durotheca rogersii]|uniref:uncharacterized protein n=1 Tax=Durotheca rogersii TaxID=419775 RepID=UPI002220B258|nr:uncharacterized protein GGS23DRAFT_561506 [Durotheca rogersii]KAI5864716.1 hypothetical protein GGS23DRAFT_561506 [Durotheca rogersii]
MRISNSNSSRTMWRNLPIRQPPTPLEEGYDDTTDDDYDHCDDDHTLVIGIDFGTTYSGVAWATAADFGAGNINVITTWPGAGPEEGKAPTELLYQDGEVLWGYEVPPDDEPVRWFKLLLLKDEDLPPEMRKSKFILRAREVLRKTGKSAVDVVADYLRKLSQHTLETIQRSRDESEVDALRFHIVITVPAIWKGYARQAMQEAAEKAGLLNTRDAGPTTLAFAPEPEAAALATLCEPGQRKREGQVYIICDAGGGTVDLISYRVDSVNPITMHEAVEGTGGLCGGIFVDEAFESMCKSRLGGMWNNLSTQGIREIMREWETSIKPKYKPKGREIEYMVRIPAEAFQTFSFDDTSREPIIRNGRIHFSGKHIEQTFARPFAEIGSLIDSQIAMTAEKGLTTTGIILVGGLGASPYLYTHLKDKYTKDGMKILQADGIRPRTAICRGAVFKGFLEPVDTGDGQLKFFDHIIPAPIAVTSTVSRASYGTVCRATFNSREHLEADRVWSSDEGMWKADNQMAWYLKRGENVSKKYSTRFSFYRLYSGDFGGSFQCPLYECEDVETPSRRTTTVKYLCDIDCKLTTPYSELPDFRTPSGEYRKKMIFEVEMMPSGASMDFAVYVNGKKQGKNNVNIRFT